MSLSPVRYPPLSSFFLSPRLQGGLLLSQMIRQGEDTHASKVRWGAGARQPTNTQGQGDSQAEEPASARRLQPGLLM